MGLLDDAKDLAQSAAEKAGRVIDDTKDRLSDKVDEVKADANVKKAEAEQASTEKKNEAKEQLRDN
jgi:ElaB/YqjD/DUF883 family membrane-anchored ribosome-binding protein